MPALTKEERRKELLALQAELAREIRKELFRAQQLRRTVEARAGGAVPTEDIDPERIFSSGTDPSIARAAGTNLLHSTAILPDTLAALGTMAFSPFIPEMPESRPEGVGQGLAQAFKLRTAGEAAGAVGRAVERLPGAKTTREATALGAERERQALLGDEPGFGRKAGVFGLELLSDPLELAPGGVGLRSIRMATAGGIAATALGVAGTRAAARKLLAKRGAKEVVERQVQKTAAQEATERAALAARREIDTANEAYVKATAERLRAMANQMVDFPQAPVRIPPSLQGQEKALEVALAEARARRKFAPAVQTRTGSTGRVKRLKPEIEEFGPGQRRAGGRFLQRTGRGTTRPFDELQSQLSREPVTGTSLTGGIPESFFTGRVEAAIIPLSDLPATPATTRMVRELGEGVDDMAMRADEFATAMQPGKKPVQRSIPVRSGLEETVSADGVLTDALTWQRRLASLFSADNMLAKFMAVRRGSEIKQTVKQVAKGPSAVATYGQMSRRLKKSTADLIDSDLLALAERSGNAMVGVDDAFTAVQARLDGLTDIDILKHQAGEFRKYTDKVIDDANDLNAQIGQKEIPYRDNYIHHKWARPKVVRNWFKQVFSKRRAKGDPEFQRAWPSYFAGIKHGNMEPVSLRFSDNIVITEMEYAQSLATKRALQQMAVVNTTDAGLDAFKRVDSPKAIPEGYVHIDNADLYRAVEGQGGTLAVHKSIAPVIRNILAERSWTGLDQLLSFAKMNNLGISTFHHFTLAAESAPALLGPVHGLRASARLRGGLPGISPGIRGNKDLAAVADLLERGQRTGRITELPTHLKGNELAREAWERAAKAGVTGEPLSDVHRAAWRSMANEITGLVGKASPTAEGLAGLVVKFQDSINRGLWDGFHTPVKIYAFNTVLDGLLNVKRGNYKIAGPVKWMQRKSLKNLSDEEIASRVARVVNDEFGGQLFEGYVGKFAQFMTSQGTSPVEAANVMRKVMLSPDWLLSSVRMGLSPVAGLAKRDPVRFFLGLRHWRNFALGAAVYANMTNYVFTKLVEGEGKFIFNDEMRRSQFHIRTPFRDRKTGETIYGRWGKQFQEVKPAVMAVQGLVNLARGRPGGGGLAEAREIAERKLNPMVGAALHLFVPPEDFPTLLQQAERRAADKGRELSDPEWVAWATASLVQDGLIPFSFRDTGVPLAPVAIAKGIDVRDAEFHLVNAMEDGKSEEVQNILMRLYQSENLQPDVVQGVFNRAVRRLQVRQGLVPERTEEERIARRRNSR